ncbi:hypothetical protein AAVH_07220, partial [Aphelenchoides avenae]
GPMYLPHWVDTSGWSRFKLTNLGNKYKRLRRKNKEMSDGHFRRLFLKHVADWKEPTPK